MQQPKVGKTNLNNKGFARRRVRPRHAHNSPCRRHRRGVLRALPRRPGSDRAGMGCSNILCLPPELVDVLYFVILLIANTLNCLISLASIYLMLKPLCRRRERPEPSAEPRLEPADAEHQGGGRP